MKNFRAIESISQCINENRRWDSRGERGLDVKMRYPNGGEEGGSRKSRIASDFRVLIPSLMSFRAELVILL